MDPSECWLDPEQAHVRPAEVVEKYEKLITLLRTFPTIL